MIKLIIYSRDRAAQLDLLLRSIKQYAGNIFSTDIIWNYSDRRYEEGYEKIIAENPDSVFYYQYTKEEFRDITLDILDCNEEHVCFSTDDEVIVKPIDKLKLFNNLPKFDNHIFSLRLGFNTIEQDIHRGTKQPPLNIYVERDGVLTWPINFYHPHHNYGYFGSLDMTIYRTSLLNRILPKINFKNTNELEGGMTQFRDECSYMSSFSESVAVNLPVNNLSGYTLVNEKFAYTNEELNEKYLAGYEIDLCSISQTPIVGSHQQIPYSWNKINA